MQVEVSGGRGRGRPSTVVDKDEGLGKVKFSPTTETYTIMYLFLCRSHPISVL